MGVLGVGLGLVGPGLAGVVVPSTLQQEASRKLSMTPRRTMAIAQQLYEGVDISGEGTVGLITYMRTDSLRLSDEALSAAEKFILGRYGKDYHTGKPRTYKAKYSRSRMVLTVGA